MISRLSQGVSRRQRGFTLIEILIVLAVLAVLAAIVIPNVSGFLGRGKERAWESDRRILQAAVDAWRTDISQRGGNPWPTVGGVIGTLASGPAATVDIGATSRVIKVSELSTGGYLKGTDAIKSFARSTGTGTGANNSPVGSYVWYIDASGLVQGRRWTPASTSDTTVAFAELAGSDGYDSTNEIYP